MATNQPPSEPDLKSENLPSESQSVTQTSLLPDSSPFPYGLTGSELAARLGVNPGTITRNSDKGAAHFAQWSKLSKADFSALYPNEWVSSKSKKIADPDGLAWQRRGDRYYTIPENQIP